MSAGTPGPWFARTWDGEQWPERRWSVGSERGIAVCISPRFSDPSDLTDACLIAAAPELLEALKAAVATIEDYLAYQHDGDPWSEDARLMGEMDINDFSTDGRLEEARAAIAKAEGGRS